MTTTYTHLAPATNVHTFCTRPEHWTPKGKHALGDLSDPHDPEWSPLCSLNTVVILGGGRFTFDSQARNGSHIEAQCLAHGEVELIGGS